jgi:hypothetical protein
VVQRVIDGDHRDGAASQCCPDGEEGDVLSMPPNRPRTVDAFIAAHFRSIEDLQLLIRLVREPERWWDAETVSHEQHLSKAAAREALEWFAARNLVEIRLSTDVRYRFSPGTDGLRDDAHDVLAVFSADPIAVIRAIPPGLQHIRDFADAFRIKPS